MKIRSDYVTNSSSSSFIIAKNDKCTIEEIYEKLENDREHIKDILNYCRCNSDEDSVNRAIKEFAQTLFNITDNGLRLNEWTIMENDYCNDDDEFGCYMYCYADFDTDSFKVIGVD